jgi:hypothetical protein
MLKEESCMQYIGEIANNLQTLAIGVTRNRMSKLIHMPGVVVMVVVM